MEHLRLTVSATRVEAAIAYARHIAADAIDPSHWGFLDQGTTLSDAEADIARAELLRLKQSILSTIDQSMVAEALGVNLLPRL